MDTHNNIIRIGTRKSPLALIQTNIIINYMKLQEHEYSINRVISSGDNTTGYLRECGGKNLFSKELHQQLLDNKLDCAIHSLKDLETPLPEGLEIAAFANPEDPSDVLIINSNLNWPNPIKPIKIGTSSLRRERFLNYYLQKSPHTINLCRGNIQTRIAQLTNGDFDAIMLAAAGLKRSNFLKDNQLNGLNGFTHHIFPTSILTPSSGQGILAVVKRAADNRFEKYFKKINNVNAENSTKIERYFLKAIHATCHDPIGVHATIEDINNFTLNIMYFDHLIEPLTLKIYGNIKNYIKIVDELVIEFKKACAFRKSR